MTRREAFTLVELLVVIAIITLLIAMLMPTLQGARHLAWSAHCKTNLAALAKSVVVYSDHNRGYMMVYRHVNVIVDEREYIDAPPQPAKTCIAFTRSMLNLRTGLLADARNYGLVYEAGILYRPEMFYCPAPIEDERHKMSHYPPPWGAHLGRGSDWIRCGYMWNPWVKVLAGSDSSDNICTYEDGLILERHAQDRFLVCDLAWGIDVSGHNWGGRIHWNTAFPDGHAASFEDPALQAIYSHGIHTDWEWSDWDGITRPAMVRAGVGG